MKENNSIIKVSESGTEENKYNFPIEEPKKNNCKKTIIIILIILLLIMIIILIFYFMLFGKFIEKSSVKEKKFTKKEMKIASYNTVIKLNEIKFPSSQSNYSYDEEQLYSYYNFTYYFFKNLDYSNFSPINLYSVLINIYMAISDKELSERLNNILGLNNEERILFYSKIFNNNYFENSKGEIKISNGAFYNSDLVEENTFYIEQITKTFTECYKLSYDIDFNFISDWINKSLKENKALLKDNFGNINKIAILFFSNLYFKQNWLTKFSDSETHKDIFYINNTYKKEVDFMKHSYLADYYDYDKYISFYDYYNNYYLIQYIIPKSLNDNILNLLDAHNFLYENEKNIISGKYILLNVPKFKIDNEIDLVPIMKKIGFEKLFDKNYSTMDYPFIIKNNNNYYLNKFIQKNQVELNEDGTTIKSKTYASSIAKSTSASENGIEIKLNQPFIYIIKDFNHLPIFIGYINDIYY